MKKKKSALPGIQFLKLPTFINLILTDASAVSAARWRRTGYCDVTAEQIYRQTELLPCDVSDNPDGFQSQNKKHQFFFRYPKIYPSSSTHEGLTVSLSSHEEV